MHICQTAIITHLRMQFPTASIKTLAAYAGQLSKQEAPKLTQLLPACLVMYIDGSPIAQDADLQYDLLVVTQSTAFDRKESQRNNLSLATDIVRYCKDKNIFAPGPGRTGTYEISRERTRARILIQDHRFTVVAISLLILDRTS